MFGMFVADRTPIDMATFTAIRTDVADFRHMKAYVSRCVSVTKLYFGGVLFIPPYIPYVSDGSRPSFSKETQDKYLSKMRWIFNEYDVQHAEMPEITDLNERISWVNSIVRSDGFNG